MRAIRLHIIVFLSLLGQGAYAQLSPGDLSDAHAELEGLANCTKCHSVGNRVPDNKCLDCHKEIDALINQNRGYHSSKEVKGKTCVDCHSEHHGRKFDALNFDEDAFDHNLTGYELEGEHDVIDCRECHKPDFIQDPDLRKRTDTYLGMEQECLACHDDYHQGTLDNDCVQCHGFDAFSPADYFDHDDADFKLEGAHIDVECIECHKKSMRRGREFQKFTDIPFDRCTDCHEDVHMGNFGDDCLSCHNVDSWRDLTLGNDFNHDLTDYPLVGLHVGVDCKECHKGSYTEPINFSYCKTCHDDYHKREFTSTNPRSDCKECHLVERPFSYTLYGLDEHQRSKFQLEGSHIATPCFACHLNEEEWWTFRNIGSVCIDCHDNIHEGKISQEYMPQNDCAACHNSDTWGDVVFDHNTTDWPLEGAHQAASCRECHFEDDAESGSFTQQFNDLGTDCIECHENVHGSQFEARGSNNCTQCHTINEEWNADNFDHNDTQFPLEGKHENVDCRECHKNKEFDDGVERVEYKIKKFECIDCHS